MNIRAMVGSHEVQNVLKRGLSSMEDDLAVVNDPNARKRDKKESLKRMSQCVDTLNIALAKQDSNFAAIKGADSANYVAKRLATAHAGQEEKAFKAWGHGGGSDAVISIDEFKTWVFSHRPGHSQKNTIRSGVDDGLHGCAVLGIKPKSYILSQVLETS